MYLSLCPWTSLDRQARTVDMATTWDFPRDGSQDSSGDKFWGELTSGYGGWNIKGRGERREERGERREERPLSSLLYPSIFHFCPHTPSALV